MQSLHRSGRIKDIIKINKQQEAAVIVMFCGESKEVLLLKRAPTCKMQGWCLPGGQIDEDELPGRAVRRETIEETGIYLQSIPMYCGTLESEDGRNVHIFSTWLEYRQMVKLSEEHTDIAWVKWFDGYELAGNTERFIQLALHTMFAMYSGSYQDGLFFEQGERK